MNRLRWILLIGVGAGGLAGLAYMGANRAAPAAASVAEPVPVLATDTGWTVGELRENGLRIVPRGRNDASAVLNPNRFARSEVRNAYAIATRIPRVLNQLYCWCGCIDRGVHRSNLQCFEDPMAVNCDVCRGTAEMAYDMVRKGVTDAGRIQAAVDEVWAPDEAEIWSPEGASEGA